MTSEAFLRVWMSSEPVRVSSVKQELARVSRAIARLPEVDRCALLLRVVEELPYEEIAGFCASPSRQPK
jgi:DNA-directed RNA polymerase specialized sigma24 family protein